MHTIYISFKSTDYGTKRIHWNNHTCFWSADSNKVFGCLKKLDRATSWQNVFIPTHPNLIKSNHRVAYRERWGGGQLKKVWLGCAAAAFIPWPCLRHISVHFATLFKKRGVYILLVFCGFCLLCFLFPYSYIKSILFYEWHQRMRF